MKQKLVCEEVIGFHMSREKIPAEKVDFLPSELPFFVL